MAHVRPHGNRIEFRFKVGGGKPFTTTVGITPTKTNLEAARRTARKAEHRLRAGESWESVRGWLRGERTRAPRTLGYYAQHLVDHSDAELSTIMGYESAYNRYWRKFDNRSIDTLMRSELEAHLSSFKVGRKTKKNALSVLRQIFALAKQDKVITEAPTDEWELKKGQDPEPDPYTEVERDKLLEALKPWPIAWRYFLMAFHTGMRTGELLGLEWSKLDKPYLLVDQARVRRVVKSTKTDEIRRIVLPPVVWDMLDHNPTKFLRSFVFLTPENRAFLDADWLMEKWALAHKKASVRRRPGMYPWRHTYISLALAHGASQIWTSKQAGHDMKTMDKKYARWIQGRRDADLAELNKIYGPKPDATKEPKSESGGKTVAGDEESA